MADPDHDPAPAAPDPGEAARLLREAAARLRGIEAGNPRLEAEYLLAAALREDRVVLFRRRAGEPVPAPEPGYAEAEAPAVADDLALGAGDDALAAAAPEYAAPEYGAQADAASEYAAPEAAPLEAAGDLSLPADPLAAGLEGQPVETPEAADVLLEAAPTAWEAGAVEAAPEPWGASEAAAPAELAPPDSELAWDGAITEESPEAAVEVAFDAPADEPGLVAFDEEIGRAHV